MIYTIIFVSLSLMFMIGTLWLVKSRCPAATAIKKFAENRFGAIISIDKDCLEFAFAPYARFETAEEAQNYAKCLGSLDNEVSKRHAEISLANDIHEIKAIALETLGKGLEAIAHRQKAYDVEYAKAVKMDKVRIAEYYRDIGCM